jgi:hypothetical protein
VARQIAAWEDHRCCQESGYPSVRRGHHGRGRNNRHRIRRYHT